MSLTTTSARKLEAIDGNEAAAYIAFGLCEFAIIFPISPSSPMSEKADAWAAAGKKNCFGTQPVVFQMESEAGVAGALHGVGATGGLGVTFTASQGLMLMIPNLYKMAGELIPAVVHVSSRQVGTSGTSIFCDHSDIMAVRGTGMAMICSANAQEAMDLAAAAHLSSIENSIPTLHWFDGYTTSHSLQSAERIPYELLHSLVNKEKLSEFRRTALDPAKPHQRGCIVGRQEWMQIAESSNPTYVSYANSMEKYLRLLSEHTGRSYNLYEYSGAPDAERVIVILGSAGLTVEDVVDWMVAAGEKVGVLRVRMFRPWSEERFVAALPKSVRRIAVLDRSREGGAVGEPLLLDVALTIMNTGRTDIMVVGGRFGIGDKLFDESHVAAVFANLAAEKPRRHFLVGVVDDVMGLALPPCAAPRPPPSVIAPRQASIWGLGSDGSVGAAHMTLKLLASGAGLQVQGQFFYTAHKSGGVTISHIRFGNRPIKGQCAVTAANYVGVNQAAYIGRYDLLRNAVDGATVVVNAGWQSSADVPIAWRRELAQKHLRLYALDATHKFRRAATLALTTVFFKLASGDAISPELAIDLLKEEARKTFRSKGEAVIQANVRAIEDALTSLVSIEVPSEWSEAPAVPLGEGVFEPARDEFDSKIKFPLQSLNGEDVPISTYKAMVPGGRVPPNTARIEKRGVAENVPVWDPVKCTQCNFCSTACPHAVIRPFLLKDEEVQKAGLTEEQVKPAVGAGGAQGYKFRIQVSVNDCTGCGVCTAVCPTKCLELKPLKDVREKEAPRWKYLFDEIGSRSDIYPKDQLRGLQFVQPLFEFSGACAGCGETPYIKMLTQLVGDRAVFACASGCNAAYAFAFGSNPYCTTPEGRGPAVAHSLFEDTAEFSAGILHTVIWRRNLLTKRVTELLAGGEQLSTDLREQLSKWLEQKEDVAASDSLSKSIKKLLPEAPQSPALNEIRELSVYFLKTTVWVIGGDGWASDIDYGGIDHVLSLGLPVKILILDTEVYSNTGGQKSKSTPTSAVHKFAAAGKSAPKKDLAMTFLASHGHVAYVASVCTHSNPAQAMRAMAEAEAFPGPAVVVCYCPCIEHGIEGSSPTAWVQQAKRAVDCGYWPIYRSDPRKDKLTLDGPAMGKTKIPLLDFVSKENRFLRLKREHPEAAEQLVPTLEAAVKFRLNKLLGLAGIAPTPAAPATGEQ